MVIRTLLRYYYAAHAPKMPYWFTIDYKIEYSDVFHAPFPHGGCSHMNGTNHCTKCIKWDADQIIYDKNRMAEEDYMKMKTFFAWRWFYADSMIKSSGNKRKSIL